MDGEARILIVEDDADLADLLATHLTEQGYDARTAGDGAAARRLIHAEDFQLVILDILLPDTTGFDLCNHLRDQRRTQSWPILFLTERRNRSDRLHGLELGVVDYITKPFDMHELRLRIRNTLQRASQHSVMNAITELPDTPLVNKRLEGLAASANRWALVLLAADGLTRLRETYGFLAVDELMRVLAMIAQAAVRDLGGRGDFAGHYDASTLVVFTSEERVMLLRDRMAERVARTLDGLYLPLDDQVTSTVPYVQTSIFRGDYDSPEMLLEALAAQRRSLSAAVV